MLSLIFVVITLRFCTCINCLLARILYDIKCVAALLVEVTQIHVYIYIIIYMYIPAHTLPGLPHFYTYAYTGKGSMISGRVHRNEARANCNHPAVC